MTQEIGISDTSHDYPTLNWDAQVRIWAEEHACHTIVADELLRLRAQLSSPVKFNHGDPPKPGLYLARIVISHGGDALYTRRSFEEWTGVCWPHVGNNGTTGGMVTGWLEIEL